MKHCSPSDFNDMVDKDGNYHYAISTDCSSSHGKEISNCCINTCDGKECVLCPKDTFFH